MPNNAFDIKIATSMLNKTKKSLKLEQLNPSEQPKLIILGGQPASGKSSIINEIKEKYIDILMLNGDEIKESYPRYKKLSIEDSDKATELVQPYSNYVVDVLKAEAADNKLNTLIEGTMRTSKVPLETTDMFIQQGYSVEAFVISCNYLSSSIGIIERYETELENKGYGKKVDISKHDEAYNNIPETLDNLVKSNKFANISIVTRDGKILAELAKGDNLVETYKNHRNTMTYEIYLDVANRINNVSNMMNNRNASIEEFDCLYKVQQNLKHSLNKISVDSVLDFFEKVDSKLVEQVKKINI
jgi:UDP-N-acetylglucosamine kinase